MSSETFVREVLIKKYLHMFEEVSLKKGMNFEPHSQNLCFEVDANLRVTGKFVIRDFGGVWRDMITMIANEGPVSAYHQEGNAQKYKFRGGHANAISSYAFFYKRQVFDMLLKQMGMYDRELYLIKRNNLRNLIDTKMAQLVAKYLIPGHQVTPNMSNKKELIDLRNKGTIQPAIPGAFEIPQNTEAWNFINAKKANGEWVQLSSGE